MIVLDTETTGLHKPEIVPLEQQPRIVEFAAIKLDDVTLEELDTLTFFVEPGIPIPPEVTKIHGITDEMVKDAGRFIKHFPAVCEFFCGQSTMIAHNMPYDKGMMVHELRRINRLTHFPWPHRQLCSVELTRGITGRYMKMEKLWEHYFGTPANQTHRAIDDVRQLCAIIRKMREEQLV